MIITKQKLYFNFSFLLGKKEKHEAEYYSSLAHTLICVGSHNLLLQFWSVNQKLASLQCLLVCQCVFAINNHTVRTHFMMETNKW